jgi:predicted aldo/keto reductase-like oxidoreductase
MKVLAGGELRHGATKLLFAADRKRGRDVVGGAVRYAAMHPHIATAVIGMASTNELVENVFAVEDVDDSFLGEFVNWTEQAESLAIGECTRCGRCLSYCEKGLEIPKIFRLYDQFRFFGMEGVSRYKYQKLSVNGMECTSCGLCQAVCPENFNIPQLLHAAHERLSGGSFSRKEKMHEMAKLF